MYRKSWAGNQLQCPPSLLLLRRGQVQIQLQLPDRFTNIQSNEKVAFLGPVRLEDSAMAIDVAFVMPEIIVH
jgi:hypothetical protein